MKFLKLTILFIGIVAISTICLSCAKSIDKVATTQNDFTTSTMVQVFNAIVNSTRNYIYVDGVPVSGAAIASGGVFPATAYAFKVGPGIRAFLIRDTLATTTQVPLSFAENMLSGRSYTIFTYDTITSVKQSTVLNNIVVPSDTTSMLRFADFIYNPFAVANVDVFSYRKIPGTPIYPVGQTFPNLTTSTPVFTNVATTTVTNFIPYASGITDTLYVVATGTTSPLLVKALIPNLVPQRSYTATYRGSYRGTRAISTFVTY